MENFNKIYADFNSLNDGLLSLDSIKTKDDLKRLNVEFRDGQKYIFYDYDEDDNYQPNYICAIGVVKYDHNKNVWFAEIDEQKIYHESKLD